MEIVVDFVNTMDIGGYQVPCRENPLVESRRNVVKRDVEEGWNTIAPHY